LNPDAVDLKGQVAVVTGGGRGIGRAIARALAAAGASVAVVAQSADQLAETVAMIEKDGGTAVAQTADVTDPEAVRSKLAEVERATGVIDLLVNNAATAGPLGPFWEADSGQWWRAMEINVRGAALCTHAVLQGMISRRRGRIVNIASGGAAMAFTYFSSYVAAKTALARFSECLATEVKPYGIAVFAMEPGTVRTAMSEHSLHSAEGQRWLPWFQRIFDEGLDLPPERAAQRVLFLASGKADSLSGRFLPIAEDLEVILKSLSEVEKRNLYSLRIARLGLQKPNPILAAIREEAERAR
jgi:NAD(P)-dependent dehydrogenase (short-subunit alcohol dehydrogenase family)